MSNETPDYSDLSTPKDFNPFDEAVVERDYTKPQVSFNPQEIQNIPEPSFQSPNLDELQDDDFAEDEEKNQKKEKPKYGFESDDPLVNQDLKDYDKKSANEAASQMVDAVLGGYKMAHSIAGKYLTIQQKDLYKRAVKGEINLDMMVPVSQTKSISVIEFVQDYNNQVLEVLVVDDEFISSVRPVMIRVFSKRGYGMSDEQF